MVCSIANRSTTASVYVDLTDETGADTYELTGQGDKVDIDLTGARFLTIRATAYPCDIVLNMTNQRANLASPAMDVIGALGATSPLPVKIVLPMPAAIPTGTAAPVTPPAVGVIPLFYDTTAVTGGLYLWNGASWVKVGGTT
jgi:hypothetical protein